jgi:type IV secretory pathway VirB10-like protein
MQRVDTETLVILVVSVAICIGSFVILVWLISDALRSRGRVEPAVAATTVRAAPEIPYRVEGMRPRPVPPTTDRGAPAWSGPVAPPLTKPLSAPVPPVAATPTTTVPGADEAAADAAPETAAPAPLELPAPAAEASPSSAGGAAGMETPRPHRDRGALLRNLESLRDAGVITDSEFTAKRAALDNEPGDG